MPKYYCEYCDIYLTHSSAGGRRQHNSGRKHINNKIEYYQTLIREKNLAPPMYPVPPHLSGAIRPMMSKPMGMLPGQMPLPGMPGGMILPGGAPPGMLPGGPGVFGKGGAPGGPPMTLPGMRPIMKMPVRPLTNGPFTEASPGGGPKGMTPLNPMKVKEEPTDDYNQNQPQQQGKSSPPLKGAPNASPKGGPLQFGGGGGGDFKGKPSFGGKPQGGMSMINKGPNGGGKDGNFGGKLMGGPQMTNKGGDFGGGKPGLDFNKGGGKGMGMGPMDGGKKGGKW